MSKFLVIQTAFIGDVVLATGIIEKLHSFFPDVEIDFLVRKGNESLLLNHPFLHDVLIWEKRNNKYINLFKLLKKIRSRKYDKVINLQRFASTGFLTAFSGSKETIGFDKNPVSFLFSKRVSHSFSKGEPAIHEIERNHLLIKSFTDSVAAKPKLYPSKEDFNKIKQYTQRPYICIAPASVWFTKQFPKEKWIRFLNNFSVNTVVMLLGSSSDANLCATIDGSTFHPLVNNLAGELSFLESAALMKTALMNFVNDSAPMHFASAMNAPVTAVYCSTIPNFGYGPLSDINFIVQIPEHLYCRPCGLHGYKTCPEKHFRCALDIKDEQLFKILESETN